MASASTPVARSDRCLATLLAMFAHSLPKLELAIDERGPPGSGSAGVGGDEFHGRHCIRKGSGSSGGRLSGERDAA